ncbi:hypothetical protein N9Y42_00475 [Mariniblastus sp.]|nr:hypothetical protein [Mariniblastus sp.]
MDQLNKNASSKLTPVAWACDVLDLDPPNQSIDKGERRDQAISAFFESLNFNDFHTDTDRVAAVEVLCGNAKSQSPDFLRLKKKQELERIDVTLDWFAHQLGVIDARELLASLDTRMKSLTPQGCSADVQRYAQSIQSTAKFVDAKVGEKRAAVNELRQAIFHISTVRQTQRCPVRSRWVRKLRSEFSQQQLTEAIRVVGRDKKKAAAQYYRPFFYLLTQQLDEFEEFQLAPPVSLRVQNTASHPKTESRSESTRSRIFGMLVLLGLASVIFSAIFNKHEPKNSPPKYPPLKKPYLIKDSVDHAKAIEELENSVPKDLNAWETNQIEQIQKSQAYKDALKGSNLTNPNKKKFQLRRPKRTFPGIRNPPSIKRDRNLDQFQKKSPLNTWPGNSP